MIRKEAGFTLIEILIAMLVFVLSLILVSDFFVGQLNMFRTQSKLAESNIEGIIGLELLRRDIEHAGYGLFWSYPGGYTCTGCGEASNAPASDYNDFFVNTNTLPRAILSDTGVTGMLSGSDYLVIRSVNVSTSATASRFTILQSDGSLRVWTPNTVDDNLQSADRVIVLSTSGTASRQLVTNGSTFQLPYGDGTGLAASPWVPASNSAIHLVYGVDQMASGTNLRMPFNRADYYVKRPSSGMPTTCAPDIGILYKAVLRHSDGNVGNTALPLLDCVADMQVAYGVDTDGNGRIDCYTDDLGSVITEDAQNIRERVREVRVYILAHEGQKDPSFKFLNFTTGECSTCVRVGESASNCDGSGKLGRAFNLGTSGITGWQNYRWKVYTMGVTPRNLLGNL